jgi:hypothetical protein
VIMLFLWDVQTPGGSARGVTDDETQARLAASARVQANGDTARVERAVSLAGGAWLTDGYRRLGSGWSARLLAGQVTWVAFSEPATELDKASQAQADGLRPDRAMAPRHLRTEHAPENAVERPELQRLREAMNDEFNRRAWATAG